MSLKQQLVDKVRSIVSKEYSKAVTKQACCSCKQRPIPKGVVAKLAGYSDAELRALPPEAVVNSFGCGNPTAFAEIKPGETVLDLGSGAGIDLLLAARKVGPTGEVIGVDMTDAMLAKARENIAASNLHNIVVRKGIIENLPVDPISVDWVISNCVINLSPHKDQVFQEIFRVLKPGGKMLVSDIVAKWLPQEIKDHPNLYASCLSGAISEQEYIAGLQHAGFDMIDVRDRLIYDKEQLLAFICSEVNNIEVSACWAGKADTWAEEILGKVWSIKIYAQKP